MIDRLNNIRLIYRSREHRTVLTGLVLIAALTLLGACSRDFRGDVTNVNAQRVSMDELNTWPQPDADGIFVLDDRRYVEVRRDETIIDVAARIGEDPQIISRINRIRVDRPLPAGKVLALPSVDIPEAAASSVIEPLVEPEPATEKVISNFFRHTVEKGETVYTISKLYEVSVRTIADWNKLGSDFAIEEGDVLLIPSVSQTDGGAEVEEVTYPVAPSSAETDAKDEQPEQPVLETPSGNDNSPQHQSKTTQAESIVIGTLSAVEPRPANFPLKKTEEVPPATPVVQPETQKVELNCTNFQPRDFGFVAPAAGDIMTDYRVRNNKGIDISTETGAAVYAVGDGTVSLIRSSKENTTVLLILHDCEVHTVYQNLTGVALTRGDKVKAGQQIGSVDSKFNFLHFEVRIGPEPTDPKEYLPAEAY